MKRQLFLSASLIAAISLWGAETVVQFFTPSVVRITKLPDGSEAPTSMVVSAIPENVDIKIKKSGNKTVYSSSELIVSVDKTGKIKFTDPKGKVLLEEGGFDLSPITAGADSGSYVVRQEFALRPDESIYGLGMIQNNKLNQRGEDRLMMQSNLEDFTNFFQSIDGYGIYWDNYSPTQIKDGKMLSLESRVGDAVDYYFMYGGDADGVISRMRGLTGKVPMLPKWSYGFHQSRERYQTKDELLEVVDKYRDLGIPFDGIIQDWQYWGTNYTWNAMRFINPDFKGAQDMIDHVHDKNAHFIISVWASFGPETLAYRELKDKGLLFDFETWPEYGITDWPQGDPLYKSGVRVYDAYSPEARDIYWKYLSELHKMGVDAWWMDSTDPDHLNYKDSDLDQKTAAGKSYRAVRNLFPYMTVGGVDSHQRDVDSLKRVFILTRSFFAGQQRYGANTWSGDVGSSWDSFRRQIPLSLSHSMTGNPNVNTDIGGFFAGRYNYPGKYSSATANPQFQELYTRWMQFGLFSPMMRSHGTEVHREIYLYGKEGEPVYDALVKAIKTRYRLLPYIYSTAWQVSENDDSFMRPLFMDFKNDKKTHSMGHEYMFGRSLLVCPIVDPLYTEEEPVKIDTRTSTPGNAWPVVDWRAHKTYEVYLPSGADWYDFYTNRLYKGGRDITTDASLDICPLFVRAGSILPWGPLRQYADEPSDQPMELRIYPGADASFELYDDAGDGYGYLKGEMSIIPLKWDNYNRTLTIEERKGSYPGMSEKQTFKIWIPDGISKTIEYSGEEMTVRI